MKPKNLAEEERQREIDRALDIGDIDQGDYFSFISSLVDFEFLVAPFLVRVIVTTLNLSFTLSKDGPLIGQISKLLFC